MPSILKSFTCPRCGGNLDLKHDRLIMVCPYCSTALSRKPDTIFAFDHSIYPNRLTLEEGTSLVRTWMCSGAFKPHGLRFASISSLRLRYIPFWIVPISAMTTFTADSKGSRSVIEHEHERLVVALRRTELPELEFKLPLASKQPYDVNDVDEEGEVLFGEIDEEKARRIAEVQVKNLQKRLAEGESAAPREIEHELAVGDIEFTHVPVWTVVYSIWGKEYTVYVDGADKKVLFGECPPPPLVSLELMAVAAILLALFLIFVR